MSHFFRIFFVFLAAYSPILLSQEGRTSGQVSQNGRSHAQAPTTANNSVSVAGITGDLKKRDGKFYITDLASGVEIEVRYPESLDKLVSKGVFAQGSFVTKISPAVFTISSVTNIDGDIPYQGSAIRQTRSTPLFFQPKKGITKVDLESLQREIEQLGATPYKTWAGDTKLGVKKAVKVQGEDGVYIGGFAEFPDKELNALKASMQQYLGWPPSAVFKLRQPTGNDEFDSLEIIDTSNRILGIVHFKSPACVLLTSAGQSFQPQE